MSAFEGKADMPIALAMSASGPKRQTDNKADIPSCTAACPLSGVKRT
jgi:hypothetical protein